MEKTITLTLPKVSLKKVVFIVLFYALLFGIGAGIGLGDVARVTMPQMPERMPWMSPTPTPSPAPTPTSTPIPTPTPTPTATPVPRPVQQNNFSGSPEAGNFPIEHLTITHIDPVWTGTPQNPIPFLNVNVHNTADRAATRVQLRVIFLRDQQGTGGPYHSEYITLLGVANPGDSTLRGNVPGFRPVGTGTVWYSVDMVSATYN